MIGLTVDPITGQHKGQECAYEDHKHFTNTVSKLKHQRSEKIPEPQSENPVQETGMPQAEPFNYQAVSAADVSTGIDNAISEASLARPAPGPTRTTRLPSGTSAAASAQRRRA